MGEPRDLRPGLALKGGGTRGRLAARTRGWSGHPLGILLAGALIRELDEAAAAKPDDDGFA
jgi:hypothetical protein